MNWLIATIVLIALLLVSIDAKAEPKSYIYRVLLAVDQLANVVFLNGHEDETISSNTAKMSVNKDLPKWQRGIAVLIQDGLHLIDPGHRVTCLEVDRGKPLSASEFEELMDVNGWAYQEGVDIETLIRALRKAKADAKAATKTTKPYDFGGTNS